MPLFRILKKKTPALFLVHLLYVEFLVPTHQKTYLVLLRSGHDCILIIRVSNCVGVPFLPMADPFFLKQNMYFTSLQFAFKTIDLPKSVIRKFVTTKKKRF